MMILDSKDETAVLPTEVTTFRSSGQLAENLYMEAASILKRFYAGSWIMGGFIGLVFGLTLARLTIFRYRNEYLANKGNCLSCARCLEYCPVKKVTSDR
jgi:ferredoxin